MMAMLSSYTTGLLMSRRAPVLALAKSPAGAVVQLRSRQPAAAASVASNESRRAALLACHAASNDDNDKEVHVEHDKVWDAMATAQPSIWDVTVMAQKDRILLKLKVGESLTRHNDILKLTTTEDQARLVIWHIRDKNSSPARASELLQLPIPPGYDGNKAQGLLLANGCLIITIVARDAAAAAAPEAAEEAQRRSQ